MAEKKQMGRFDNRLYNELTGKLRRIKTPEELSLLRKAVEISCLGQNEVMKAVHPNMSELEIQGLHEFVHKKLGAEAVGYGSIIGSGENGCVLHYMENIKTKIGTSMILMDVGAEYHGYTADVTRTVPVDGKFSAEERAIYQLVYDAQEAAFSTLKDGSKWSDASNQAREIIANGLMQLGIIKEKSEVGKYFPHGLGHHIGLDEEHEGVRPEHELGVAPLFGFARHLACVFTPRSMSNEKSEQASNNRHREQHRRSLCCALSCRVCIGCFPHRKARAR